MTSQPDKIFRDKFENFQRPAPAAAWDRIEKNISKPVYKLAWARIAAGIALLAAAAIMLWPSGNEPERVAQTKGKQVATPVDTLAQPELKKEEAVQHTAQSVKKNTTITKSKSATPSVAHVQTPADKSQQPAKDSATVIVPPQRTELVADIASAPSTEKSTVIVYTSDEVNSKFLKKKLSPEATSENKDASGIQKLIGLAYAAKNSEAGLADLRQKKDELLALNFGKKKGEN